MAKSQINPRALLSHPPFTGNSAGADLRTPVDSSQKKVSVFHQIGGSMVTLERETGLNEIGGEPEASGKPPRAKFGVFGEEMIEKEVKPCGNTGRVYLPLDWVGKHVKIIRID